jgi:GT2 family glycosyltransferase
MKISFIISNYNTLDYTIWSFKHLHSFIKGTGHEIILINDGSTDGTFEWMEVVSGLPNVVIHNSRVNKGIPYSYNKAVELSSGDIICMLHSDMYVKETIVEDILWYIGTLDYDYVGINRCEPPVYPPSFDKVQMDFGTDINSFNEAEFRRWSLEYVDLYKGQRKMISWFPWAMKRETYVELGGMDSIYSKYMVEDWDFCLRLLLNNKRCLLALDTIVYHMPSKSSYMKDLKTPEEQQAWNTQFSNSSKNFIRKWKINQNLVFVSSNSSLTYISPKVYDVGVVFQTNVVSQQTLDIIEPQVNNIYCSNQSEVDEYIAKEQANTKVNLTDKFVKTPTLLANDVVLYVTLNEDGSIPEELTHSLAYISVALGQINEAGTYKMGENLTIEVKQFVNRAFEVAKGVVF